MERLRCCAWLTLNQRQLHLSRSKLTTRESFSTGTALLRRQLHAWVRHFLSKRLSLSAPSTYDVEFHGRNDDCIYDVDFDGVNDDGRDDRFRVPCDTLARNASA
eukprot:m.36498 g.36498  ORF g.36498 m.36498 type:complete len:104 (-) comp12476_c1_seq2:834-1145(-)